MLSSYFTGRVTVSPAGTPFSVWRNPNTGLDFFMDGRDLRDSIGLCSKDSAAPYVQALEKLSALENT